ncbi:MAG: hypothetical protein A3F10_05030 [Coxiella sp. RIFCSPHIGHO2_12_FULL_42_15]|nr:MAG: hypothetical protein A3F10_05030 [Coxiella sp. RIFCSPHIGHO2_12_FULL_42_15]
MWSMYEIETLLNRLIEQFPALGLNLHEHFHDAPHRLHHDNSGSTCPFTITELTLRNGSNLPLIIISSETWGLDEVRDRHYRDFGEAERRWPGSHKGSFEKENIISTFGQVGAAIPFLTTLQRFNKEFNPAEEDSAAFGPNLDLQEDPYSSFFSSSPSSSPTTPLGGYLEEELSNAIRSLQRTLAEEEAGQREAQQAAQRAAQREQEEERERERRRRQAPPRPAAAFFSPIVPAENEPTFQSRLRQVELKLGREIDVPDRFLCPISANIMNIPVLCTDGNNYDQDSALTWIGIQRNRASSPLTREPNFSMGMSNEPLKREIIAFLEKLEAEARQQPANNHTPS